MNKKYREIEFTIGSDITSAVMELIKLGIKGEFVCGNFNGSMLYSDTVSLDSAYSEICDKTYFEFLNNIELTKQRLIKEDEDFKASISSLEEKWIKKGKEILDSKYHSEWKRIVPIRLKDMYRGVELKDSLEIISKLNKQCRMEDAKSIIDNQDHSGMSYSLVRLMVKSFCK